MWLQRLLIFGIMSVFLLHLCAQEEPKAVKQKIYNVGYRIMDITYKVGGGEKVLTIAVWYPTDAEPQKYKYGDGAVEGNIALDAEPRKEGGPFPFLVFSHGYGGGGIGSIFFTELLAAQGWIVAAPDH